MIVKRILLLSLVALLTGAFVVTGFGWQAQGEKGDGETAVALKTLPETISLNSNSAPTNTYFSYQGQLLGNNGEPISGSRTMTFKLFPTFTGGTSCWQETQTVAVENGIFTVLLGSEMAIDMTDDCLAGDIYLELTIGSTPLDPRQLLTSVAYALEAATLPDGATTRGSLSVNGEFDLIGEDDGTKAAWFDLNDATTGNFWRASFRTNDQHLLFTFRNEVDQEWSPTLQLHENGNITLPDGNLTVKGDPGEPRVVLDNVTANSKWRMVAGGAGNLRFWNDPGTGWNSIMYLTPQGSCALGSVNQAPVIP